MQDTWAKFEDNVTPKILIAGVGGAGINILNTLIKQKISGVTYVALNTDSQSLQSSLSETKIPLGVKLTKGFGTGGNPEIGKQSAIENIAAIQDYFKDFSLIFFVGGLGGGTGSGALPILTNAATQAGVLNVSIVTLPFSFEGEKRKKVANSALDDLSGATSSYVIIPNENFFTAFDNNIPVSEAFGSADMQIANGIQGITDIINTTGQINLDFADIKSILDNGGQIMVNSAITTGDNRVEDAVSQVLENHLIDKGSAVSAKQVLLQISGGTDIRLSEVKGIMEKVRDQLKTQENFVFGTNFDKSLNGKLILTLIATGLSGSVNTDFKYKSFDEFIKPILDEAKPVQEEAGEILDPLDGIIEITETTIIQEIPTQEDEEQTFIPLEEEQEVQEEQEEVIEIEEVFPMTMDEVIIEEFDDTPQALDISSMAIGQTNEPKPDDKNASFSSKLKNIFGAKEEGERPVRPEPKPVKKETPASYDLMDLFKDMPSLNEEENTFESFLKEQDE